MALTVTEDYSRSSRRPLLMAGMPGDRVSTGLFKLTFDNSYPTGGEAIDLSNYFQGGVLAGFIPANSTHFFVYDTANSKILAFNVTDGSQVTNGSSDLNGVVVYLFAFGID